MKKEKINLVLFIVSTFILFYVFFAIIHPLIPFDSDDWENLSHNRSALIDMSEWNPGRVLPHMLMPICGDIAGYFIYPICKDYLLAHTIVHAGLVSICITGYCYCFYRLLRLKFKLQTNESILYSLLFLSLHFLALRATETDNQHFFYSQDVTCYYFYIIPNILNASLVLLLLSNNWIANLKNNTPFINGIIVVLLYLSLCSNLYSTAVFVLFLASKVAVSFPWTNWNKDKFKFFLKNHYIELLLICAWLLIGVCESFGARAHDVAPYKNSIFRQAYKVFEKFLLVRYNWLFILMIATGVLFAIYRFFKAKRISTYYIQLIINSLLAFCFVITINTQVYPHYAQRSDVLFSVFFPIFILIIFSFVRIQHCYKHFLVIVPFLLLLTYSSIVPSSNTFRDLSIGQLRADYPVSLPQIREAEVRAINQIIEADKGGAKDSIFINVPDCGKGDGWPWHDYGFRGFTRTLKRHKLINSDHSGKYVVVDLISK